MEEKMTLKQLIETKYGNIDSLLEKTNIQLSRTYLYMLLNNEDVNPSLEVMKELARVLEVDLVDIIEAILRTRH